MILRTIIIRRLIGNKPVFVHFQLKDLGSGLLEFHSLFVCFHFELTVHEKISIVSLGRERSSEAAGFLIETNIPKITCLAGG